MPVNLFKRPPRWKKPGKIKPGPCGFLKDAYDIQKEYWEESRRRRPPNDPVIEAFAAPKVSYIVDTLSKHGGPKEGSKLLDVGSGNGFFAYYLEKHYRVTALDFASFMLKNNPADRKVSGSAMELPFRNSSFDITFCSNLLHHVPDPGVAVSEMVRVTKSIVVLSEPNRDNPMMFLFGLLKAEERGTLKFNRNYLKSLLMESGCRVLAARNMGGILPNKTPSLLLPVVKRLEWLVYPSFYSIAVAIKER